MPQSWYARCRIYVGKRMFALVKGSRLLKKPTPQRLAKLMRQWRQECGLSVSDAGDMLGLSPRTIEGIEQERGFAAGRVLEIALLSLSPVLKTRA